MRRATIFFESFLDGFTMAGFFTRLRRPGAATEVFAPARTPSLDLVPPGLIWATAYEQASKGNTLKSVPEHELHAMIALLQREEEDRRTSSQTAERTLSGTSN